MGCSCLQKHQENEFDNQKMLELNQEYQKVKKMFPLKIVFFQDYKIG